LIGTRRFGAPAFVDSFPAVDQTSRRSRPYHEHVSG